jgi:hypothetical protein
VPVASRDQHFAGVQGLRSDCVVTNQHEAWGAAAPRSERERASFEARLDHPFLLWDNPTMIATADQKRRIVLPKPVEPGDVLDISVLGPRMILQVLKKPTAVPPVATRPVKAPSLAGINLDEPAFLALTDESPA